MENIIKQEQEIERKWLLKRLPTGYAFPRVLEIIQYYYLDGEKIKRLRVTKENNQTTYEYIWKEMIDMGSAVTSALEHSFELDVNIVSEIIKKASRVISKTRYVCPISKTQKAEIDVYNKIRLITMEVELVSADSEVVFPEIIQNEIIAEVTGIKNFSNYDLATIIK